MKTVNRIAIAAALLLGALGQLPQSATAEMLSADSDREAGAAYGSSIESETLYAASTFVRASALTYTTLQVDAAGTLFVELADLAWSQAFESLTFTLAGATGVLGEISGPGLMSFDVGGPATFFAGVHADAAGLKDTGLYHLDISFVRSVVPLPAAGWLLFSGLGGLALLRRRRAARD
jgi:hypothetical protein